jgi:cytochrome P450
MSAVGDTGRVGDTGKNSEVVDAEGKSVPDEGENVQSGNEPGQSGPGQSGRAEDGNGQGRGAAERGGGRMPLVDLADPAVLPNPYPVLAKLREASPFSEFDGALVVVGGHADCSRILRDPQVSSERSRSRLAPPGLDPRAQSFLSLDPPDHTRLRRLVSKAFTARVVSALAPRIRSLADELITAAGTGGAAAPDGSGELELVSQLAYPLPVRIISEMLGVPVEDHARFAGWSARLASSLQPPLLTADPQTRVAAQEARLEFADYFRELIAARRGRPADDLLSELIRAEDEGERLTEDELIATCVLLLVAGHETTVGLISNAILALLRHPEQFAALRADPDLAAGVVEETLRYDAPVQMTGRVTRSEMQIGDVTAAEGTVLLLLLAATGRDPAAFADPDRFDIRRAAGSHLAFAAGPHFCLGAPLARLEATITLQAFAARVAEPELDEARLVYKPNLNLRGPERLVVAFSDVRPAVTPS